MKEYSGGNSGGVFTLPSGSSGLITTDCNENGFTDVKITSKTTLSRVRACTSETMSLEQLTKK